MLQGYRYVSTIRPKHFDKGHWKDLDIRNPFCPCPGLNTVSKICQPVSFAILAKKWITRKFVRHLQIWQIIIVFKIRRFMFCKVFGILQLKLFNLFQAFNSWGSSKRCEQKKKKERVAPYFLSRSLPSRHTPLSEGLEKARNYFMTCQFVRFWHGVLIIFCRVFGVACCLSFIRNSYCTETLAKQHQLQR